MSEMEPSDRNCPLESSSATLLFRDYAEHLYRALKTIQPETIESFFAKVWDTVHAERQIFVAGNGGSASIADHLCCDWTKGATVEGKPVARTHSLSSNVPLMTALANDRSYSNIFSDQLTLLGKRGDMVILISSSGNSPNVLEAAAKARILGIQSVGMTGFDGGKLGAMVDIHLHVHIDHYGIIEDCHQAVMHALAHHLRLRNHP